MSRLLEELAKQAQLHEDDLLLYQLGKGPNPNAVTLSPEDVTEDNEHRVCGHCGAGVLAEGYCVGGGETYYCTADCFNAADPDTLAEFMEQEEAYNADPDEVEDYDPDWCYWTTWGPED